MEFKYLLLVYPLFFLLLGMVLKVVLFRWKWSLYFISIFSFGLTPVILIFHFKASLDGAILIIYPTFYTFISLIGVFITIGLNKAMKLKDR